MKKLKIRGEFMAGWIGVILAVGAWLLPATSVFGEDHFQVLKVGTHTYTNVTVTSKANTYIFILHNGGMQSLKVADLPPDVARTLGYAPAEDPAAPGTLTLTKPAAGTETARSALGARKPRGNWASRALAYLAQMRQLKGFSQHLKQSLDGKISQAPLKPPALGQTAFYAVVGVTLVVYLFLCYCFSLICQKTGQPAGFLVWVPCFQWIALLRAADMSGWWFLALMLPGLNLLAGIIWSFRIAQARGKSPWVGLLLLLPVINLLALLYLAFSGGGAEKEERRIEVMTLEAA